MPDPATDRPTNLALDYVDGGFATYLPGETFGPRRLRDHEFVWVIEGDATYEHDGAAVPAPAGTVILGRPGVHERYVWDPRRATRHAFFHFSPHLPSDWPPHDAWPVARPPTPGDAIRPLFRRILDRWCLRWGHQRQPPPPSICRLVAALIDEFLAPLDSDARPTTTGRELPDPVRRAVQWVQHRLIQQPDAPVALEDLAEAAKISPSQLIRLFRQSLGLTPMRALQLMRLEQAMTLLHRSNLTVSQVAHRCGFASPFHFSRVFSRTYGLSPTAMRQRFDTGGVRPASPLPLDAPPLGQW